MGLTTEQLEQIRQRIINWIAALKSGQYEQGENFLCKNNKYCCLGVATKLVDYPINWYDKIPNPVVRDKYGLTGLCGGFNKTKNTRMYLDALNDDGTSFNELADLISSCPNGLFIPEVEQYLSENPLAPSLEGINNVS